MQFLKKSSYNMQDLVLIMELLRSENGCPWDREQTHESIRQNVLEEAYEVAEAIDMGEPSMLCEELGDLLLQVVFHSQMEKEKNSFSLEDVADGICKKLVHRHPHIFGDTIAESSDAVLDNWNRIKKQEKGQNTATDTIVAVPSNMPALMRCQKVRKRAAAAGFNYPDIEMAIANLEGELAELKAAIIQKDDAACFEELGDVLFSTVNVAGFLKVDAELSLTRSCEKFIDRFRQTELIAKEREIDLAQTPIDSLNDLWGQAKNRLAGLNK